MCKGYLTPSYDSLFTQKLYSHITHIFVYSLHAIAFKKFSLQSKVYQSEVIIIPYSLLFVLSAPAPCQRRR